MTGSFPGDESRHEFDPTPDEVRDTDAFERHDLGQYEERSFGRRRLHPHERSWWARAVDEVSAWFGDRGAEGRRTMDAAEHGQLRDEARGDTGWSDPFSPSAPHHHDQPTHEFGHRHGPPDNRH